jgi:hypothetical protein
MIRDSNPSDSVACGDVVLALVRLLHRRSFSQHNALPPRHLLPQRKQPRHGLCQLLTDHKAAKN